MEKIIYHLHIVLCRIVANVQKYENVHKIFAVFKIPFDHRSPLCFLFLADFCIAVSRQINKVKFAAVDFKKFTRRVLPGSPDVLASLF